MQKVYRTKLPESELVIWRETLLDYSYEEFERAMKYLLKNPPKYDLEDGTTQTWRGMPKLSDVVDTLQTFKDKEYQAVQAERRRKEWDELEKRRAEHPEEFFTLADVLKKFEEKYPNASRKFSTDRDGKQVALKGFPEEKELTDRQWEARKVALKKQYEEYIKRKAESSEDKSNGRTDRDDPAQGF